MDVREDIAEVLLDGLKAISEGVVYQGDGARVELLAAPCDAESVVDAGGKTRLSHADLDWQFAASALTLNGRIATPKPGHRIMRLATGESYEVLPRDNRNCWERDSQGIVMRVHTKAIST